MKLTLILLLVFTLQLVSANGIAQSLTWSKKNATIEEALTEIRKQTGYHSFYDLDMLKEAKPFDITVKNAPLEEVLRICFENQPITYSINRNTVIIKRKTPSQYQVADPITVSGRVVDSKGAPLPGTGVLLKGSTISTVANSDGRYTITIPEGKGTLVFSFIGFGKKEVEVTRSSTLDVVLEEANSELNDVVIVGYGTVRKSDLTGSVAQVKGAELNAFPTANALQALNGRAAGVQVSQQNGSPGSPVNIRVRGTNSIRGSNEPLYVIDGYPTSGSPSNLNNADIESIEILKDASATAIYGNRGANGVVIITTKRGKSGRTNVELNSSYSTQHLIKKLDLMNAKEYALFYNEQAANDKLPAYFTQAEIDAFGEGFDWQDLVFESAPMQTLALNVNGGNEKTQFSVSGSLFSQNGIVRGSDYDRYSVRANLTHEISKMFSVNLSTTMSRLSTKRKDSGRGFRGNSMISAAVSAPPTLDPYNADGSYRVLATAYPFIATDMINPLNHINEDSDVTQANIILTNASVIFRPISSLTFKFTGGIENRDDRNDSYRTRNFVNSEGIASVSSGQDMNVLSENTVTYQRTFAAKHSVTALAGFTYQDFISKGLSGSGRGFLSDAFETSDLAAAGIPGIPATSYSKSTLISFLGRINYGFAGKYLFTASYRQDGSSKYSTGEKWGHFPSAAVAWKVSEENFLKGNRYISDLKLRASWGITGSQAIGAYATLNQLNSGKTVFDNTLYNTFGPTTTLREPLKWETTEQKDIGLDLGVLNNRITFTADYYHKTTRDLLNIVSLPTSMGYSSTIRNVGQVKNTGFELGASARIFEGALKWDLSANISFNRNKVQKLYNSEDILNSFSAVIVNDVSDIIREGRPIGQFFGYRENGYTAQGKLNYEDVNGDGVISALDRTYIGNPNPDFIYGINSNLSFKNFDLNIFIQGTKGNDIFNASSITNTIDYGFGVNMPKEVFYNHWTPSNPEAKYPLISNNIGVRISDRFIEDGSYLRLKNIQLGYNIPMAKLGIKGIQNIQIYASGQNLLTITNYSWWDPEVNTLGGANSTRQGYDHNSYPTNKSYTFGLRATF